MDRGEWEPEFPWKETMRSATVGARWRIYASVVIPAAWIIAMLLYAGFWSGGFSLVQSLVIFFASLIAVLAIVALMWISIGLRFARGLP